MENQYVITNHALQQFMYRFYKELVHFKKRDIFQCLEESKLFRVHSEHRDWIEYYYNKEINAVFVVDHTTMEILTVLVPLDRVKYREAFKIKLSAGGAKW